MLEVFPLIPLIADEPIGIGASSYAGDLLSASWQTETRVPTSMSSLSLSVTRGASIGLPLILQPHDRIRRRWHPMTMMSIRDASLNVEVFSVGARPTDTLAGWHRGGGERPTTAVPP